MTNNQLSLRNLATFLAVSDCGGIAKAAEQLGYTQPAVTLQLQQLERHLGVSLFERKGRSVTLTRAGYRLVQPAQQLLREVADFEKRAAASSAEYEECLAIAAIEPAASTRLSRILSQLRKTAPDITVKVSVLGGDNIAATAHRNAINAAITVPTSLPGWTFEALYNERLVALVPADHDLASQRSVALSRIAREPLVLTDESCVYRRLVERSLSSRGLKARTITEISSLTSLPSAVSNGLGIAIVPRTLQALNLCPLKILPLQDRVEMQIGILRPSNVPAGSAVERFVSAARSLSKHWGNA